MKLMNWKTWRNVSFCLLGVGVAIGGSIYGVMFRFPGKSYRGHLPPLTKEQNELSQMLRSNVEHLASDIGERSIWTYDKLEEAANYLEESFRSAGYPEVKNHEILFRGKSCRNLEVEIQGKGNEQEIVIIGAHYDTVPGCPGANDNGSGVAALLALARAFSSRDTSRTLRFVAFTNEESPSFAGGAMGSAVYAAECRRRQENVVAMLSLETIGYYTSDPDSQIYPDPLSRLYPSEGNFVAFVSNIPSRHLARNAIRSFRRHARFPSEAGAFPKMIADITRSDHASFWAQGYPALMVTDTAPFRYPYYHTENDTPDKIQYDDLARVVEGLHGVVADLVK